MNKDNMCEFRKQDGSCNLLKWDESYGECGLPDHNSGNCPLALCFYGILSIQEAARQYAKKIQNTANKQSPLKLS